MVELAADGLDGFGKTALRHPSCPTFGVDGVHAARRRPASSGRA